MVQLTERASVELRRLLSAHLAQPHQGVRLCLDATGGLRMTIDVPHAGDSIFRRDHQLLLIVDGRLSQTLAQRVLDVPADAHDSGFELGWRVPPIVPNDAPEQVQISPTL
jgi:Fe-S cluster assembly iron-binding protein IscA